MTATYDTGLTEQHVRRATEKALCFPHPRDGSDLWLPKKLVSWRDNGPSFLATVEVPLWFAKDRALITTARNPGH